jgi:hypothetical protein|tara:strand:+ start:334 stop:612 length:279 start_codon:yes stop_codon:yes gene_type:complete
MANLHKGIRAIHNNVVTINGDTQEDIIAWDKDGNTVSINWTNVNAWEDPDQYKYNRAKEYPSVLDQLDKIYHEGIDEWKKVIKATKDKYPKE